MFLIPVIGYVSSTFHINKAEKWLNSLYVSR